MRYVCRASAVVIHDGKVLLVAGKKAPGYWLPPGGKVDPHECAHEAAARETLEEAGARVRVNRLIAYREVWFDNTQALELYFAGSLLPEGAPGDRARTADHEWQWAELDGLPHLRHLPDCLELLCELAASAGRPAQYLGALDLRGERQTRQASGDRLQASGKANGER